jgi:hypothetical protein
MTTTMYKLEKKRYLELPVPPIARVTSGRVTFKLRALRFSTSFVLIDIFVL